MNVEINPLSEQQIKNFVQPENKYFVMGATCASNGGRIYHVTIAQIDDALYERCKIFLILPPQCLYTSVKDLDPTHRLYAEKADKLVDDLRAQPHILGTVTDAKIVEPTLKAAGAGDISVAIFTPNGLELSSGMDNGPKVAKFRRPPAGYQVATGVPSETPWVYDERHIVKLFEYPLIQGDSETLIKVIEVVPNEEDDCDRLFYRLGNEIAHRSDFLTLAVRSMAKMTNISTQGPKFEGNNWRVIGDGGDIDLRDLRLLG